MKLPLTLKNKPRNTNLKFDIKKYFFGPPNKCIFIIFEENPLKNLFSSSSGVDSALKTINTQMFFCSVFLKTHKKNHLAVFGGSYCFFVCIFKNTDKNNICVSINLTHQRLKLFLLPIFMIFSNVAPI